MAINPQILYQVAGRSASRVVAIRARRFAFALSLLAVPSIGDPVAGAMVVVAAVVAADAGGRFLWRPLVAEDRGFSQKGADIAGVVIALVAVGPATVALTVGTVLVGGLKTSGEAPIGYAAALTWLAVLFAMPAGVAASRHARRWALEEVRRRDIPGFLPPEAVPDEEASVLDHRVRVPPSRVR